MAFPSKDRRAFPAEESRIMPFIPSAARCVPSSSRNWNEVGSAVRDATWIQKEVHKTTPSWQINSKSERFPSSRASERTSLSNNLWHWTNSFAETCEHLQGMAERIKRRVTSRSPRRSIRDFRFHGFGYTTNSVSRKKQTMYQRSKTYDRVL